MWNDCMLDTLCDHKEVSDRVRFTLPEILVNFVNLGSHTSFTLTIV